MATNILVRDFKVLMQDLNCVDVSSDVQVRRVFTRLGLIAEKAPLLDILYCARTLNADYPGAFDLPCWEIGRTFCRPKDPDCDKVLFIEKLPKKEY